MSTKLEHIDAALPLELCPCQHDLDGPGIRSVELQAPIVLLGHEVVLFLEWAKQESWRGQFERDLQSIANDGAGRKLLTTWMPLVTFREGFCSGGRTMQDADTQALMERLRNQMMGWRSAQVDTVEISGRAAGQEERCARG